MVKIDIATIDRALEALYPRLRDCTDTVMDIENNIEVNSISAAILTWSRIRYNIVTGGGGQTKGKTCVNSDEYAGWLNNDRIRQEGEYQYGILRNLAAKYNGTVPNTSGLAPKAISYNAYARLRNWGDHDVAITAKFVMIDVSEALTRIFPGEVLKVENKNPPPLDNVLGIPEETLNLNKFKKSLHSLESLVATL